uniref:ACT domain-containing protein ACR n=1 Tax=Helianthus annuus TaxID=4232 RepID=A0A251VQ58_HELAN
MDGSTTIKPEMLTSSYKEASSDAKKAMSAAKLAELALADPKMAKVLRECALRFFSVSNEPQLSSNVVIAREDLEVMELLEFLRKCPDRPKLLFDTVCTLTDMQYVVYHATIIAEGVEASQELYIRHTNGCPVSSEVERERVIHCPEAVIKRQVPEGVKLELCGEDSVVLLSDVSRIFRENGLSITRVEVTMRGYYNFLLLIHHFPYFIN